MESHVGYLYYYFKMPLGNPAHDPSEFSFLEIDNDVIIRESDEAEAVIPTTRSAALTAQASGFFDRCPPEIRRMMWNTVASNLFTRPRVVEIHEVRLEISYRNAADPESMHHTYVDHLRSTTPCPMLLHTCIEAREEAWKFLTSEKNLGNQYCPDVVFFNFEIDTAYFTKSTLVSWMPLWKDCSLKNYRFPLNNEDFSGLTLRENLQSIAFDAGVLLGVDDDVELASGLVVLGDTGNMRALGPGLASFPALKDIVLVLSETDASAYLDLLCGYGDSFTQPEFQIANSLRLKQASGTELDRSIPQVAEELVSCTDMSPPQPDSKAYVVLREAEAYLAEQLPRYLNGGSTQRVSRAFGVPTKQSPSQPRQMPRIRTMVRNTP